MIYLNQSNGTFKIDDLQITPNSSKNEFANYSYKEYKNEEYTIYSFSEMENGESTLSLMFKKEKILSIDIGVGKNYALPPFGRTNEEKDILYKRLRLLGGDKSYSWGYIELNDDIKGGVISISIKYK